MNIKTLLVAAAIIVAPPLALAQGCNHAKEKQAMSCAAGTTYDTVSNSCLPVST